MSYRIVSGVDALLREVLKRKIGVARKMLEDPANLRKWLTQPLEVGNVYCRYRRRSDSEIRDVDPAESRGQCHSCAGWHSGAGFQVPGLPDCGAGPARMGAPVQRPAGGRFETLRMPAFRRNWTTSKTCPSRACWG